MRICTPIHIRYADTDKMGIVYHGNYPLYYEDARTDFLRKVGYPYEQIEKQGYLSPMVEIHINYDRPLIYGQNYVIRTYVSSNRPAKTKYIHEIFREDMDMDTEKPLSTGWSVVCMVDANTFRPINMKKCLPDLYNLYEQIKEEE